MEAQNKEEFRAQVSPFGGGMDWLEVRIPPFVPFRAMVTELAAERRARPDQHQLSSAQYRSMIDLRPHGLRAVLHLDKRYGEGSHKVQMIATGQFSMREHIAHLASIVDADPLTLQPMRTDLTVDLPGVTVGSGIGSRGGCGKAIFCMAAISKPERAEADVCMTLGRVQVQTFYCGKRPNCIRVYDKKAERRDEWARAVRGWHPPEPRFSEWCKRMAGDDPDSVRAHFLIAHDAWERKVAAKGPKPTFRQFCGMDESDVLTRFERQIGAQQVGKMMVAGSGRYVSLPISGTIWRSWIALRPFPSWPDSASSRFLTARTIRAWCIWPGWNFGGACSPMVGSVPTLGCIQSPMVTERSYCGT